MISESSMIEAGKFLQQRYRIDKQIGQGGMGAVYVATDERFGSTVAIKETLCMDENFRKAIEREARLLNSLKHSALPRVSDHFVEDDGQFLVMEFIDGDDLATIIERGHAEFALADVLKWADQLLDALEYLHTQSVPVIHRDIKPQNLKITSRGDVILLDFGLAKGNPTDAGHQTAAKSIFGYSRNYASLEQIQGTGTDPRSDLYSLAATLYHLMTGHAPEDALTRAMAVLSQKADPLVPANHIQPKIPDGVAGVVHKALDLNASERPASATEMRQMLRENESYAYLTDVDVATAATAGTNILGQQTRLMGDSTASVGQHEIKTEVFKPNVSQVTSVKPAVNAAPQTRRGFALATGALAVLIGGSAITGGIYLMNPSAFGFEDAEQPTPETTADISTVADINATNANSNSAQNLPQTSGATQLTEEPITESASQESKNKSTATIKSGNTVATKTLTNNDAVETDGKTTTPTNQGEIPTADRRPLPTMPSGIDPRDLTPEQRRKLRNAIRRGQVRPPANQPPQ